MNQMKKEELEIIISDSDRIECAIRHIQTAVDVDPWARDIAVEAMRKQIPKKPKSVFCPQCGEEFTDDDCWSADYCRNCGQAIDWTEGE